jgi:hypothetical protein
MRFSINLEKANKIDPINFNYIPSSRRNLDEGSWIWK